MSFRFAVALAAPLLVAGAAEAKPQAARLADATPAGRTAGEAAGKELTGLQAARERQKKCIAEWRDMSAAERSSAGPKWPQFYSKCVKRQKAEKP